MKWKILADFQICISVHLMVNSEYNNIFVKAIDTLIISAVEQLKKIKKWSDIFLECYPRLLTKEEKRHKPTIFTRYSCYRDSGTGVFLWILRNF